MYAGFANYKAIHLKNKNYNLLHFDKKKNMVHNIWRKFLKPIIMKCCREKKERKISWIHKKQLTITMIKRRETFQLFNKIEKFNN